MPPWPGAFRASQPFVHPEPHPSFGANAETGAPACPAPDEPSVRGRVAKAIERVACAKKDVRVPVVPRDGRIRTVPAQDGLPDPAIAGRVARGSCLNNAASNAGQRGDAGVKARGRAPAASI